MKKIIMDGPRKSRVIDVEIPKINDNQLLVKVLFTGMCHSEFYPWSVAKKGDSFGHEAVGIVVDKGINVQNFKIGDRVSGLGGGGYQEYIVQEPNKVFVTKLMLPFYLLVLVVLVQKLLKVLLTDVCRMITSV